MRTFGHAIAALVVWVGSAHAQSNLDETKVVVVPVPAEVVDAGVSAEPPAAVISAPLPKAEPPPVLTPAPKAVVAEPVAEAPAHPREGAFLSGPGSVGFIVHHTLMGAVGGLATQLVPRLVPGSGYLSATDQGARTAYLVGGLGGAAIGFAASAIFQFYQWQSEESAGFAALHSLLGAMLFFGVVNLGSQNPHAYAWFSLLGAELAGWGTSLISSLLMKGEFPVNKGLLIASGAIWATYYTGIVLAIVAALMGSVNGQTVLNALMIAPGAGALVMGLASLKLNPSSTHILRATGLGLAVGIAGFLLSALIIDQRFDKPWPYVIGGVLSAGTTALVAFLWDDSALKSSDTASTGYESAIPNGRIYW